MSSFPSRRRRRLRRCGEVRPSADWADLPIDALLSVLQHLETIELMLGGAGRVCRSWHRAIRDEPELWRRIDMRIHKDHKYRIDEGMAKEAVRRGSGRCESFWGEDATDHFLLFLAEQAPSLKSLRLISSKHITNEGLLAALNKFPVLEELELSLCKHVFGKVYEGIGIACPHLKYLRVAIWKALRNAASFSIVKQKAASPFSGISRPGSGTKRNRQRESERVWERKRTVRSNSLGGGNLAVISLNPNFWVSTDLEKASFPNPTLFTLRHLANFSIPASWSASVRMSFMRGVEEARSWSVAEQAQSIIRMRKCRRNDTYGIERIPLRFGREKGLHKEQI